MANVTYLLGAGASCKCLPSYANFGERFRAFRGVIEGSMNDLNPDERRIANEIIQHCDRLIFEFSFHNTPDTIAKKYFHQAEGGLKNLNNLKILLVLYFMYEQCVSDNFIKNVFRSDRDEKTQLDKRYDAFIASILEPIFGQLNINPSFSILTWNYDLQFELCFKNYYTQSFSETHEFLQCIPSYSTLSSEFKFNPEKFSIIHLNGIAYNQLKREQDAPFNIFYTGRKELVQELIQHYQYMQSSQNLLDGNGLLNFAWERSDTSPYPKHALDLILKSAKKVAQRTEVLVIIGYSFPIFNRSVDSLLFSEMKNLNKIYIQSPIAEDLKNMLSDVFSPVNRRVHHSNIIPVNALEYFHIPHEANQRIAQPYIIQ